MTCSTGRTKLTATDFTSFFDLLDCLYYLGNYFFLRSKAVPCRSDILLLREVGEQLETALVVESR
jgi:hypothetical protein